MAQNNRCCCCCLRFTGEDAVLVIIVHHSFWRRPSGPEEAQERSNFSLFLFVANKLTEQRKTTTVARWSWWLNAQKSTTFHFLLGSDLGFEAA